jgi:hypothetical protein
MTLQMMLEIVRQQFPDKMDTQVRIDLNSAYRMYSEETRLPFMNFDIVQNTDGVLAIAQGATLTPSRGWYLLPVNVNNVVVVTLFDSRNNEIFVPDYHIEYIGRRFGILDLNNMVYSGDGLPTPIVLIRFGCSVEPVELSVDTDVPDYPDAFHQGLVDHVLAKYFGYKGILQQSGWFRSSYQTHVQAGKRYFNRNIQ